MDRRKFIQSMGMAPVALVYPVTIGGTSFELPKTAPELTVLMERMFEAKTGSLGRFIYDDLNDEYQRCLAVVANIESDALGIESAKIRMDYLNDQLQYITISYYMEDVPAKDAEELLCKYLAIEFRKICHNRPCLVWRTKPVFESEKYSEFGPTWMTQEMFEDRFSYAYLPNGKTYKLSPLVSSKAKTMPADINMSDLIPKNVALDSLSGSYKYIGKTKTRHQIRMRISVEGGEFLGKEIGSPGKLLGAVI